MKKLLISYLIGFILSVILTVVAFYLVKLQLESDGAAFHTPYLIIGLVILAVAQLVVQLLFFFHLGKETRPRLNTVSFLFMLMVVSIIAFGSLWIMYNLDYNMMPHEVEKYIELEEGIKRSEHAH